MSLCNCCDNPRINEACHKHAGHQLSLFCADKQCMEPLCVNCVTGHKQVHVRLNLPSPVLLDLREVEDFTISSTKKQIDMISDIQQKIHKPSEAIDRCVDRFFYGSTHRRSKLLQQRHTKMLSKFTPQLLVKSIESDHQYTLPEGFRQRYYDFLDELVREVARKNAVSVEQKRV